MRQGRGRGWTRHRPRPPHQPVVARPPSRLPLLRGCDLRGRDASPRRGCRGGLARSRAKCRRRACWGSGRARCSPPVAGQIALVVAAQGRLVVAQVRVQASKLVGPRLKSAQALGAGFSAMPSGCGPSANACRRRPRSSMTKLAKRIMRRSFRWRRCPVALGGPVARDEAPAFVHLLGAAEWGAWTRVATLRRPRVGCRDGGVGYRLAVPGCDVPLAAGVGFRERYGGAAGWGRRGFCGRRVCGTRCCGRRPAPPPCCGAAGGPGLSPTLMVQRIYATCGVEAGAGISCPLRASGWEGTPPPTAPAKSASVGVGRVHRVGVGQGQRWRGRACWQGRGRAPARPGPSRSSARGDCAARALPSNGGGQRKFGLRRARGGGVRSVWRSRGALLRRCSGCGWCRCGTGRGRCELPKSPPSEGPCPGAAACADPGDFDPAPALAGGGGGAGWCGPSARTLSPRARCVPPRFLRNRLVDLDGVRLLLEALRTHLDDVKVRAC